MPTSEPICAHAPAQLADSQPSRCKIVALEAAEYARWDRFVLQQPRATFFHQTAWMKVMTETYGYRPYYFYAERDGQVSGVAPVFLISNWVSGRSLISLPFAVYGGVVAADSETEQALVDKLEALARDLKAGFLELRNRAQDPYKDYHANPRYATFTIPLISDTERLRASFPKDIRYMIRKGEKAGLETRLGFDQLDEFYKLMSINLRRLGTPAFPKALFENLIRYYGNDVELMLAYDGKRAIAGAMSFNFRDSTQPYYFGSLEEAKGLAANNFLWWRLIERGARQGFRTFDFGRSKKESGNFEFKKKWNPKIETLGYQIRLFGDKELPNVSPNSPKFRRATDLWKKLPLGVTRIVGPRVVRWFP
jgi:FemAB-related protein (PEP-CTERM system-associated)